MSTNTIPEEAVSVTVAEKLSTIGAGSDRVFA